MGLKQRLLGESDPPKDQERSLREELRRTSVMADFFQESLSRLELAQEDAGWRKLSAEVEREFTRAGLDDIVSLSRAMYLSHPLINRGVNVTTFYTFAQGIQFKAKNDKVQKTVIDPTIADDGNKAELFAHQAMVLTDVDQQVEGNVFLAMYTDRRGYVEIRSFPVNEIREIHHKEGDKRMITYYRRVWTEQVFDEKKGSTKSVKQEALYPDWRYHPRKKPKKIGQLPVEWDAPMMHQRTGGLKDMLFGVPETYSALDWARAFRKFLENWATLIASLSKFAWQVETKGRNIQDAKKKMGSTIEENEEGEEDNPAGPAGQAFIGKQGDKLTPIPKTGAHTSAEDGKQLRLMVAAALNIPDTILSNDPQQGALATAKTLDRPTELFIRSRQQMWADLFHNIFRYIIDRKIESGLLPGDKMWNERKGTYEYIPHQGVDEIEVSFPPILEHDMEPTVRAIVTAATLEGRENAGTLPRNLLSELLMQVIGVKDIEEAIAQLTKEQQEELDSEVEELREQVAQHEQNNGGPEPGPEPKPKEED